jgi:hypothetical protein
MRYIAETNYKPTPKIKMTILQKEGGPRPSPQHPTAMLMIIQNILFTERGIIVSIYC